jgi:hypothetical protein
MMLLFFLDGPIDGIGHQRTCWLNLKVRNCLLLVTAISSFHGRVVSVETSGKLIVRIKALEGDKQVAKETSFNPLEASSSIRELEFLASVKWKSLFLVAHILSFEVKSLLSLRGI